MLPSARGDDVDVLGFWKIKKVMMLGDDNEDPWKIAEDVLASDSLDRDMRQFLEGRFLFDEDGKVKVLVPLPEGVTQEEVDQAVAQGIVELYGDDLMVGGAYLWKAEDGKVFVDSGFKGKEHDWCEVTETDGMLDFLTYKLVRE